VTEVTGLLEGVRVADFTHALAGPYATTFLGDLGADVIKIEPPAGEMFRHLDHDLPDGRCAYFAGANRNKRSLVLDLKRPGAEVVRDALVNWADVVVYSFRRSVVEKLGLDYPSLTRIRPDVIACELTAFGATGPRATQHGTDLIAQGVGGIMGMTGEPDGPPMKVGPPIGDYIAAYLAAFSISAALYHRERTGAGKLLQLNLLDGQIASLANFATSHLTAGRSIHRAGARHPQLVPYQIFAARDGYFTVAVPNNRFFRRLCESVGFAELADDPRFASNAERVVNQGELLGRFEKLFAERERAHWVRLLTAAEIPCGPVLELGEALRDEQVAANAMVQTITHPAFGDYQAVAHPVTYDGRRPPVRIPAPDLGEHSAEVLAELGLSEADVRRVTDADVPAAAES
jgi:crotonobetainyl-CoA:carnitine CoA-transferase CaiB-like acyl-CoA transferase